MNHDPRRYISDFREANFEGSTYHGEKKTVPWRPMPFKVFGEGDKHSFEVGVNTDPRGDWELREPVRISGDMHGRLMASNRYFNEAMSRDPKTDVVYIGSPSNAVDGDAGRRSTNYLHHNAGSKVTHTAEPETLG